MMENTAVRILLRNGMYITYAVAIIAVTVISIFASWFDQSIYKLLVIVAAFMILVEGIRPLLVLYPKVRIGLLVALSASAVAGLVVLFLNT